MSFQPFPRSLATVLIDDDADDLLLLHRSLVKTGLVKTIRAFTAADKALAHFENRALMLSDGGSQVTVLCDLRMPNLDGFGFLQRVRQSDISRRLRIIMISGCAFEADVERARALGADGYLEKMPSVEMLRTSLISPTFAAVGSRQQLYHSWEESHQKMAAC